MNQDDVPDIHNKKRREFKGNIVHSEVIKDSDNRELIDKSTTNTAGTIRAYKKILPKDNQYEEE